MSDKYRWEIQVRRYNIYGNKVESRTPMTVVAGTRSEVTDKVRLAFEATYDSFRKFWSHGWALISVEEVSDLESQPAPSGAASESEVSA